MEVENCSAELCIRNQTHSISVMHSAVTEEAILCRQTRGSQPSCGCSCSSSHCTVRWSGFSRLMGESKVLLSEKLLLEILLSQTLILILENSQFWPGISGVAATVAGGSAFCFLSKRWNSITVTQRGRVKSWGFFSIQLHSPKWGKSLQGGGEPGVCKPKQINVVRGRQSHTLTQDQITPRGSQGPHWQRCVS